MYWVTRSWDSCDFATRAGDRDSAAVVTKPQGPGFPTSPSFGSGTLDVRLWSKLRLESPDLPNALIGNILYCIVKYVVPQIVFPDTMHTVMLGIEATDWPSLYRMHSTTNILRDEILLLKEGTCLEVLTKEHSEMCVKNTSSGETALNASEEYSYSNDCLRLEVETFAADVLALSLLAVQRKLFTVFAFTSIHEIRHAAVPMGFPETPALLFWKPLDGVRTHDILGIWLWIYQR